MPKSLRTIQEELHELVRLDVLPRSVLEEYVHPATALAEADKDLEKPAKGAQPDVLPYHPATAKGKTKKLKPLKGGALAKWYRAIRRGVIGSSVDEPTTDRIQEALERFRSKSSK